MPSTAIQYGTSATQGATSARDWVNLANLTLAPDDVQATITALLALETSEVALIGPDGLGIIQPPGFVPQSITLTPRVADSGFADGAVQVRLQLHDGTTAIGNLITMGTTAAALTTYTVTATAAQLGVALTRGLIGRLRVGVSVLGNESTASSNVGIDSVGVVVSGPLAGSSRGRPSRGRLPR